MSTQSLTPTVRLDPPLTPPRGSKPIGVGPAGQQLWRLTTKRSTNRPAFIKDENGKETKKELWELHPTTGTPLYRRYVPVLFDHVEEFFMESEGNGNTHKVIWSPPTEEELAAEARAAKVAGMIPALAEALVDGDVDPLDLVARLQGGEEEELPALEKKVREYPRHIEGKTYLLSNKARFKGSEEEAIEAEDSLPKDAEL